MPPQVPAAGVAWLDVNRIGSAVVPLATSLPGLLLPTRMELSAANRTSTPASMVSVALLLTSITSPLGMTYGLHALTSRRSLDTSQSVYWYCAGQVPPASLPVASCCTLESC